MTRPRTRTRMNEADPIVRRPGLQREGSVRTVGGDPTPRPTGLAGVLRRHHFNAYRLGLPAPGDMKVQGRV